MQYTEQECEYIKNDTLATKAMLNSIYGRMVNTMNNDYIVIHRANNPIIIFKKSISAIERGDDGAAIIYSTDATFYVDEKYTDVVKLLF